MKIKISVVNGCDFTLEVSEDLEVAMLKASCELKSGVSISYMLLQFGRTILYDNDKTLKDYGISDGSCIMLTEHTLPVLWNVEKSPEEIAIERMDFSGVKVPEGITSPSAANVPIMDNLGAIRTMFLGNSEQLTLLRRNNPRLAEALLCGNVHTFSAVLREQIAINLRQHRRCIRPNFGALNAEVQKMIAEQIRQKNIEANMEAAIEHSPETFGAVTMLFINCHVNGFPVKAFIDSGAQSTIMSAACAKRCNIMRLIDTRWAGIAKGVGVQRIIGRIHMVEMKIENNFLTTSFSVLEKQPMDMLLGLDMLKRHQCNIDLKRGVLQIGTTGTETPFLPESELPACAQLSQAKSKENIKKLKNDSKEQEGNNLNQASTSGICGQSSSNVELETDDNVDPSQNINSADPFGESEVEELVGLGFTREQVIYELRQFNGDKTQATAALFAKSLKF